MNDEITIPYYAIHTNGKIFGFFGAFRFLSNFYILENGVCLDEIYYPSVEHAYQAAKWPYNMREQFLGVTAGKAKKLGRAVQTDVKWSKMKVTIMFELCRQKFINNPKLKQMLFMTEGCVLEERNNWNDTFWGTNEKGEGENTLGKILMNIRHDLKMVDKKEAW